MATDVVVLKELLSMLGEIAALDLAEPWDNVGLMVGDPAQVVSGVLVALDPTEEVLAEAENSGCNVLLTHHPLIFKPLKAVVLDSFPGRLLGKALKKGIAVIGCHTNLDKAVGGVNDILAEKIGLSNCRVLEENGVDGAVTGFGRIGNLASAVTFDDFSSRLLKVLEVPILKYAGVKPAAIESVAVCGGSGSELAEKAMKAGTQVFITGEVKHSTARWAEDAGYCVIDGGHFSTENLVVPGLVSIIRTKMREKGIELSVKETGTQSSPFNYVYQK